jgi:maleylpyruvate isomerase
MTGANFDPGPDLERLHHSHARLNQAITGLTDADARRPSLLPGWSVGHVLAHLARNAESVVRRLEGAVRGEVVDQYPGGPAGRAQEIEAGAHASAAELLADVATTSRAVELAAAHLSAVDSGAADPAAVGSAGQLWDRLGRSVDGVLSPVSGLLRSRRKETEIHHVDLGLGYTPADWPADFVEEHLALELPELATRAAPAALLAWLTGRAPAPELSSWG